MKIQKVNGSTVSKAIFMLPQWNIIGSNIRSQLDILTSVDGMHRLMVYTHNELWQNVIKSQFLRFIITVSPPIYTPNLYIKYFTHTFFTK